MRASVAVRDRFGAVTGAALFLRDVSQLRALERAAREHERLESLGTLAAGIAHDFNNLVGALLGFADLGLAMPDDIATVRMAFTEMRTVGLRPAAWCSRSPPLPRASRAPPSWSIWGRLFTNRCGFLKVTARWGYR